MTTSRNERIIIWITSAALGVFAVACVFWTPFDRLKLLRPIPANAVMISSHRDIGSRMGSLATNIFLKAFFDSNETAFKNLRKNRYAARILSSRLIIMAYVPDFNQFTTRGHAERLASAWSSNPAYVISSWVGGWSPILRWALWIHPPKDIAPLGDYNGHRLWTYKKPVQFSGAANYFSFAIDEGIFIGCLSQDKNGVVYLLKNSDGRKDSILNIPQCRLLASSTAADQVWLRVGLPSTAQNKTFFTVCSLDALKNDYLAATIRFDPDTQASLEAPPRRVPLNDFSGLNQDMAEIGKMYACSPSFARRPCGLPQGGMTSLASEGFAQASPKAPPRRAKMPRGLPRGASPSIIALFPSEMVAGGLNGLVTPTWSKAVKPILAPSSGTNNVCLLMVLTGAYGGQFGKEPFKITVPTLLLAVSGCRQEQTKTAVLELLDLINLKHRLGLILNSTLPPAGQCPVFAIESTSSAPLNSLPVEDQPAFAFYDDWFLLASNCAGLRKLLISFQSQAAAPDDGNDSLKYMNFNIVGSPPCPAVASERRRIVGDRSEDGRAQARPLQLNQAGSLQKKTFVWIDPGEGGKALRFVLTASIIMLDADGPNQSKQNTIKILKAARSWLESISGLKNCAAWMESENGKPVVRLEIGRKKNVFE